MRSKIRYTDVDGTVKVVRYSLTAMCYVILNNLDYVMVSRDSKD